MDINLIISWSAIGLFALAAIAGFIRGIFKGTFRSLADNLFVLLNALVSTLLSKFIMSLILTPQRIYSLMISLNGQVHWKALEGWIEAIEPYMAEGEFLAEAELGYVLALPAIIITPIMFMLVFFLMGIIFKIIKLIVQKLLIPKTKGAALRLLGGALGAVRTVLALAIFLVPVIGFATFGIETLHEVDDRFESEGTDEIVEIVEEYEAVVTDGAFGFVSNYGGRWFFETLSTAKVEDAKISLVDETKNGIDIYEAILPLLEIDSAVITEKEVGDINSAIETIEKSEYLSAVIASVMSQVSNELFENGRIFEYELPYFGESFDPVVEKLLEVWSTTDKKGIIADLRTYTSVLSSLVENGLFEELDGVDDDLFRALENGELYSDVLVCLYVNERTRPVVPIIANAAQSYLFEIYEEVNGFPYDGSVVDVDESIINEASLNAEGMRISVAIQEIHVFITTVEGIEYVDDLVKVGDFESLGKGLNQIRDSIFFGNSYRFLLDTLLHSELCINLGIFDSKFIESATKPNADMAALLLSRQHVATLTMAMWDGDKAAQEDALKVIIEEITAEDEEALLELVTPENLDKYGVRGEKGATISALTTTLVETLHQHQYESEEEKHEEALKTAHILTVINSAHIKNGAADLFSDGNGVSKSGETAEDFVSEVLDSMIAAEMLEAAANKIGDNADPYNIHKYLSDNDVSNLEDALSEQYESSSSSFEDKETIKNIADIFGVSIDGLN